MEKYDVELHLRYRRRVIACIVLVVACWVGIWCVDWFAGLLGMLANGFVLLGGWFWLNLYPERK